MKLTSKDQFIVKNTIELYIRHVGENPNGKQLERTIAWMNGQTFDEIAEEDGVSKSAVQTSVSNLARKVLDFAKSNVDI